MIDLIKPKKLVYLLIYRHKCWPKPKLPDRQFSDRYQSVLFRAFYIFRRILAGRYVMSLLLNPGYQFIPCTASRGIMPSFYKHFYFDNTAVCVLYRALLESDCSNKEFTRSRHIYSQLKPLRSYSYNLRRILISPFYF